MVKYFNTKCPKCRGKARRETDTMPQWAGSSWYYLRYIDPHNDKALVDKAKEKYWSPVDFYVGGAEHATLYHDEITGSDGANAGAESVIADSSAPLATSG